MVREHEGGKLVEKVRGADAAFVGVEGGVYHCCSEALGVSSACGDAGCVAFGTSSTTCDLGVYVCGVDSAHSEV